jgi:amidophosphoribosyltransferase
VQQFIGADWLIYQDLADLEQAVHHEKADIDGFDSSCFSGKYVTGDVSRAYLDELEVARSNFNKARRDKQISSEEVDEDTVQIATGI